MSGDREQRRTDTASEAIRPGTLTALLHDLARAPEADLGAEPPLVPGARVGRYELVAEIGRGGFGVVWEARDAELDRPVALKLVRAGSAAGLPDERLLREAEAAARLSHPNVVTLYDAGRSERGPYLVLELLRGETLAQRLASGPVAAREAVRIAAEIAKGLAHAHERGIVHRDLTPGNVFLCDDGQVKILDLGLAHAFGRLKVDGGTPAYMAPEQRRGAPEDERTDVFALGVILHRLISGELPFPGDGGTVLEGSPPARHLEVPAVPTLPVLVARMLAIDPVQRPRNAGEVVRPLLACLRELEDAREVVASRSPTRLRRRPAVFAVVATAALVAVSIHARRAWLHRAPTAAGPTGASIAVLPFADMSPQRDQEYLSDGISEEILNTLTRVEGLRVIGRRSSFAFKGKGEDVRAIGAKLGVDAVLDGSVRKAGTRVRIAVQLVNVAHGYQTWSASFDRELTDVFSVQSEIAKDVVAALDVRMRTGAMAVVPARPTTTPEAYEAYLLGKRRRLQSDPDRPAEEMFMKAVTIDPAYAPAWAELVRALVQWGNYVSESQEARSRRRARAVEAADRAIALAPQLPDGYEARALVRQAFVRDRPGARADIEQALALDPGSSVAHGLYAIALGGLDEREKSLDELRIAIDLDPLNSNNWTNLGYLHLLAGRLEEARSETLRSIDIDPGGPMTMWNLGQIEILAGRPSEALAVFERNKVEAFRLLGRILAHHDLGNERESRAALTVLTAEHGANNPDLVAVGHAWLGDKDEACAWLERAVARYGEGGGLGPVVDDLLLRNLRGHPRYAAVLRRTKIPGARWH